VLVVVVCCERLSLSLLLLVVGSCHGLSYCLLLWCSAWLHVFWYASRLDETQEIVWIKSTRLYYLKGVVHHEYMYASCLLAHLPEWLMLYCSVSLRTNFWQSMSISAMTC